MSRRTALVPARMSFEDCARSASLATRRANRRPRVRELTNVGTFADPPDLSSMGSGGLLGDWSWVRRGPDDDARSSMTRLRGRARELEHVNAYAESFLNALSVNLVGPDGFTHQAQVKDNDGKLNKRINDKIEDAFARWSESVTRDGTMSLIDFEHMGVRTVARDGEMLVRECYGPQFPFGYALEPIDADLLDESYSRGGVDDENEIRLGVEVDADGRRVAYHLLEDLYRFPSGRRRPRTRVEASRIIHLARFKRPNETRGITWMRPVMIALWMLDGYEEAELLAARAAAAKMGFFVNKSDMDGEGEKSGDVPKRMDASPGVAEKLAKGWEFQAWSPDHPTAAFPAFQKGTLRKCASGLHMSYNALTSDLEGVNYSSMRSGLLVERDSWKCGQRWWRDSFRQRIYRGFMNAALLSGELSLDTRDFRKFLAVKWHPRGWAWVDPLKDITAAVLALGFGLGSRTDYLGEEGKDFETVIASLRQEMKTAAGSDGEEPVNIMGESPEGADVNAPENNGKNGHRKFNMNRVHALLELAERVSKES